MPTVVDWIDKGDRSRCDNRSITIQAVGNNTWISAGAGTSMETWRRTGAMAVVGGGGGRCREATDVGVRWYAELRWDPNPLARVWGGGRT
jgi:hypothetical protein